MKRGAVFGNAGGGKSTLARRLFELTGLPLYLLRRDAWIIVRRPPSGRAL